MTKPEKPVTVEGWVRADLIGDYQRGAIQGFGVWKTKTFMRKWYGKQAKRARVRLEVLSTVEPT